MPTQTPRGPAPAGPGSATEEPPVGVAVAPSAGPHAADSRDGVDDPARLAAVRASGLLDTEAEAAFDDLAALAGQVIGLPFAFVTVVDDRRSYWKAAVGLGIAANDTHTRQNTVQESFCQYVVNGDGPVVIDDAANDPLTRDNPSVTSMGVRAWAGFPVRGPDGHVLGSFCVVGTEPHTFTPADLRVLETLAAAASREIALRAALDTARELEERSRVANYRLLVQAQAASALGSSLEPAEILGVLAETVVPEFGSWLAVAFPAATATAAFGTRPRPEPTAVAVVEVLHADPDTGARLRELLMGFPLSTQDSHGVGAVIGTGRIQAREELDLGRAGYPLASAQEVERLALLTSDGALTVPLSSGGRVLGAMTVGVPAGGEWERGLLADLARRAALALDNAFVYGGAERAAVESQAKARRHDFLARAGAALHRRLDPATELRALAELAVPELADLCTVHVLASPVPPGEMPPLPVLTDRVAAKTIPGVHLPAAAASGLVWNGEGDPITAAIAHGRLLRRPILTADVPEWARSTGSAATVRAGLRRVVVAPVLVEDLVVAVVCFGMCHERPAWSADELDVLEEVVRYAGIALDHGMDYQRTRDSALVLQRSLLADPPAVAGLEICARYQPAGREEVGGDWYDAFALTGQAVGLVVGDVVGHDIAAAAAMGQLRAALRALAYDSAGDPREVVGRLAAVNGALGMADFATLVYARLHRTGGGNWAVRWCNAGHPPPLLMDACGRVALLESPHDAAVNVWTPPAPFHDHDRQLGPGATLLLYTDGLVERRGQDIATGLEDLVRRVSLMATAPLADLCDALLVEAPTADDVALLAVRVASGAQAHTAAT